MSKRLKKCGHKKKHEYYDPFCECFICGKCEDIIFGKKK